MWTRTCYVDRHGLYHRCFSCGAFRNHDEPGRWDALPAMPAHLHRHVSHALCERCFEQHHGEAAAPHPALARM